MKVEKKFSLLSAAFLCQHLLFDKSYSYFCVNERGFQKIFLCFAAVGGVRFSLGSYNCVG